jgi:hypothetical protein
MSLTTIWTVVGIWFLGGTMLVVYLALRAWWAHRQLRRDWQRTPILGPVRVNVRRVL